VTGTGSELRTVAQKGVEPDSQRQSSINNDIAAAVKKLAIKLVLPFS
jgi:hypothetical protein